MASIRAMLRLVNDAKASTKVERDGHGPVALRVRDADDQIASHDTVRGYLADSMDRELARIDIRRAEIDAEAERRWADIALREDPWLVRWLRAHPRVLGLLKRLVSCRRAGDGS